MGQFDSPRICQVTSHHHSSCLHLQKAPWRKKESMKAVRRTLQSVQSDLADATEARNKAGETAETHLHDYQMRDTHNGHCIQLIHCNSRARRAGDRASHLRSERGESMVYPSSHSLVHGCNVYTCVCAIQKTEKEKLQSLAPHKRLFVRLIRKAVLKLHLTEVCVC